MGASSSSATGIGGKERRKSTEEGGTALLDADKRARRLLLQNGLLRRKSKATVCGTAKAGDEVPETEEGSSSSSSWQKKAHSMYDLQQMRGKSMEAEEEEREEEEKALQKPQRQKKADDEAAGDGTEAAKPRIGIAGSGRSAKKHRLNKTGISLSKSLAEQGPPARQGSADPLSPCPSPAAVVDASSQQQQDNAQRRSPGLSSSSAQRRRPLTWAWIRGHDVNLPAQKAASPQHQAPVEQRRTTNRRRSLRAGMESRLSSDTSGGCLRQNSANANPEECSTANGGGPPPMGRRCSQQANASLFGQSHHNSGGIGPRQKSTTNRRSEAGLAINSANLHPISVNGREIIQFCFDNPHNEIGSRICSRLLEKRPDFRQFAFSMGKERWQQMTGRLKEFLESVVRKVDNIDMVERLSRKYGEEHVGLKCFGFKPDFWVSLADAMTVECVILDQATHQPSDTITAWSLLVSIMFSSVRDGYYQALRAARISQRHRNVQKRENSFNNLSAVQPASNSPSGVEKSASANELQSPKRKGSGGDSNNKCSLNQRREEQREKSTTPSAVAVCGASGVIVEERSIPVQFF